MVAGLQSVLPGINLLVRKGTLKRGNHAIGFAKGKEKE